jgi:hypothetical protein
MDAESFTELALRVIAGESTADEQRALEAELAAQPLLREEFEQLKITHDVLRVAAPMTEAVRATEPELPAYRLNELRTAVRQHFGPAAHREKKASGGIIPALRWIFAGGGATALAVVAVLLIFVRGGDTALAPSDIPTARLITFEQDAPFDQWQGQPLAWYEHAKIWVDNEHDLLHIVRRESHGHIIIQNLPLAPTTQAQRDQIKQTVESLDK